MKKLLIALILVSSTLMILSLFVHSTTSNVIEKRIGKPINKSPILPSNLKENEKKYLSVSESVYDTSSSSSYPVSILNATNSRPSDKLFLKEPDKVVYLTIDDGPDPNSTPKFLEVLQEHDIKATFFMIGATMEKNPQLVKDIFSQGHAIGNHSYTHNYGSLYKDTESLAEEINKTEDIIFSITGTRPKIFRAPGGSQRMRKTELVNKLDELGYAYFDWNASSADTDPNGVTKKDVIDNIKHDSSGVKKVITLMHDNHRRKASLEALPELIEWFKENGYEFRTLNENVEPFHFKTIHIKESSNKNTITDSAYRSVTESVYSN